MKRSITGVTEMAQAHAGKVSRRCFLKLGAAAPVSLGLSALGQVPATSSALMTTEAPALRQLATRAGLQLGTGINGAWLTDLKYQEKYKEIVGREFTVAVVNWGLYWPGIEPQRNHFDFSTADRQISFAQQKRMTVRGHALVFPTNAAAIPEWVVKGGFSRDQLVEVLRHHVTSLVGHYRRQVREWVVVNEPYVAPYRTNDIFHQTIGADCDTRSTRRTA
jgi:endo-1,4-beta-xylanase